MLEMASKLGQLAAVPFRGRSGTGKPCLRKAASQSCSCSLSPFPIPCCAPPSLVLPPPRIASQQASGTSPPRRPSSRPPISLRSPSLPSTLLIPPRISSPRRILPQLTMRMISSIQCSLPSRKRSPSLPTPIALPLPPSRLNLTSNHLLLLLPALPPPTSSRPK